MSGPGGLAESAVAGWMRYHGFPDAAAMDRTVDTGVHVIASRAVAQVRTSPALVGIEDLRRLVHDSQMRPGAIESPSLSPGSPVRRCASPRSAASLSWSCGPMAQLFRSMPGVRTLLVLVRMSPRSCLPPLHLGRYLLPRSRRSDPSGVTP